MLPAGFERSYLQASHFILSKKHPLRRIFSVFQVDPSNGGALAMKYALDALDSPTLRQP